MSDTQLPDTSSAPYVFAPEIGGQLESAQVIERSLASLVPLAESRGFGFLSYLLRLGLLEAANIVSRESEEETDTPSRSAG